MMFAGKNVLSVGIASLAIAISPGRAVANQHPHPHKGSLEYLDRNSYAKTCGCSACSSWARSAATSCR